MHRSLYLFGNGELKTNPIHGNDLTGFCLEMINRNEKEIEVGGPQTLTQKKIAEIAFRIQKKEAKNSYISNWIRKGIIFL